MADATQNKKPLVKRSRTGCVECRRRHRRCDEVKPACSYCTSVDKPCTYSRSLSWGGRPFAKSRFGKCMNNNGKVIKITLSNDSPQTAFVYGRSSDNSLPSPAAQPDDPTIVGRASSPLETETMSPDDSDSCILYDQNHSLLTTTVSKQHVTLLTAEACLSLNRNPDIYPAMSPAHQTLLDYFVHSMVNYISCHPGIKHSICSSFIPMALSSPYLLAAVLHLSGTHKRSAGLEQDKDELIQLQSFSLRMLRTALNSSDALEHTKAVATTLLLCVAEVHSNVTDSWRMHLRAASTMLTRLKHDGNLNTSTIEFLSRLYTSLEAIALSCSVKSYESGIFLSVKPNSDHYIDDFAGFSTSLIEVYESINKLDSLDREESDDDFCDQILEPPHFQCRSELDHQSHLLFDRVRAMLKQRKLTFRSEVEYLSESLQLDFFRLDEAYHHMALLRISQKGHLSVPKQVLRESIHAIISSIGAINLESAPSPGVASLAPLFIAGSVATELTDRKQILELMEKLWVFAGMGNVKAAKVFLKEQWRSEDLARHSDNHVHDIHQTRLKQSAGWDILVF